tara:strand:+ start:97 stop:303 length:207 start_codon:yes stop_codon:yes gene_type:complete
MTYLLRYKLKSLCGTIERVASVASFSEASARDKAENYFRQLGHEPTFLEAHDDQIFRTKAKFVFVEDE